MKLILWGIKKGKGKKGKGGKEKRGINFFIE